MFKYVSFNIISLENVQLNFKTTNFVPYNPKKIIDNLDFKFWVFTFLYFYPMNFMFINLNMLYMARNAIQNFGNLKFKIIIHQNNSFNYLCELIDMQIKNF